MKPLFFLRPRQGLHPKGFSPTNHRPRPAPSSTPPAPIGAPSARPTSPTSTAIQIPGHGKTAPPTAPASPSASSARKKSFTNFELVAEWRHHQPGGNSGIFVWTSDEALADLKPGTLPARRHRGPGPRHGYAKQYEESTGKKADWFTTHGDVFPVGTAKMKPFPPTSPGGERSFPKKNLVKDVGEWNHYYVRAINGEVRLWVNGEEVSGGNECDPRTGYLCLESEGAPVEFKNLRIRELP